MESEICDSWKENDTFQTQNKLSLERNDEVCFSLSVCACVCVCFVYFICGIVRVLSA